MINSSDILHGKILIVDDQKANITLLERMLRGARYLSISSTTDPTEVCELHLNNRYDLIMLDLEMPSMDGFQLMEELKEIEPGGYLPVLVITAHTDQKLRALKAGAKDFVSKPLDLAEVLARVYNLLEVRLLYRETKSYSKELEQKVWEVEASRELILRQSDEVKRLYEKLLVIEGKSATALAQAQTSFASAQLSGATAQMPGEERHHTLLYVDDKLVSQSLIEQIVARIPDIRMLSAATGKIGIEVAHNSLPDVILIDINLPDISGFKVLEILRTDPLTTHIPVIALSGNALPINIETGLEAGFFRYLTKPIKVDEFMAALEVALKFAEEVKDKNHDGK